MKSNYSYRLFVLIAAFMFGVFFSAPSLLQTEDGSKVNLGLDLQGGLYMLLGVKTDEAVEAKIESIASGLNYFCESEDILIDDLSFNTEEVTFQLLDDTMKSKLDEYIKTINGLDVVDTSLNYVITLTEEEIKLTRDFAVTQSVETIRNRLDQFGLAEPTVARQGLEKILVELPGIKTQEEEQRARKLIGKTAHLLMMAVDEERAELAQTMTEYQAASFNDVLLEDVYNPAIKYVLKKIPILDGSKLTDARVGYDENNRPVINFSLDGEGARIFGDFSGSNVGKRLAVVLDDKVYSDPVIRERIGAGSGQISGNFTTQEASDLAIALRSGALAASVTMLEKRSVGPSLGADSIKAGAISLISGFVLVAIFMVVYYGYSGIISNVALIANLFIILAVMALFGATLTLPGMVGIVLTVGMAVDANVIINERIKELIFEGKSVAKAIEDGYANAFSAIFDANITTLIAAIALYAYGTGPIKGFALTLSIGILASMLTAITGTRGLYDLLGHRINKNNRKRWFGIKSFKHPQGGK
ncbi:MAG: protein translocase subunit SecD [Campylobacterales bacterium]|nr:protein translocase subunit SecD [Campylobacterales bacterium]